MNSSVPLARRRRAARNLVRAGVAVAAGAGLMLATSGVAQAAPVRLNYPLQGETVIKGTNSTLELGPGVLEASADLATGVLTANTKLPPAEGEFKMAGFLPVSVTTEFIESEPTKGTLDLKTGAINSTTKMYIKLRDLKIGGIPAFVGSECRTEQPVVMNLKSEPGFNPFLGGTLKGTYTIPEFENCLLSTWMINLIIPGEGNTVTLNVGAAQQPPA